MKKQIIATLAAGAVLASSLAVFSGCFGGGGATEFSWWLPAGDSAYYDEYENNPVLDYISKNVELKGEGGEMKHISFNFEIPANTSAAVTDFNNMIQNREFEDVMEPSMYSGSLADLYEHNAIIDLTPYATSDEYMPNLNAWLKANPDLAPYCYITCSDGSKKILAIPGVNDALDAEQQAFGFQYRRDLLVKYGTQPAEFFDPMKDEAPTANPKAGQKFTGAFAQNTDGTARSDTPSQNTTLPSGANGDSWVDDVVFPSGNKHPVYISDWQWMFEVFEKANLSYMLSIYYPGYNANGDLTSGFGGGGAYWYKDSENKAQFGATTTGFRAYLECMNNWYNKGWLDKSFNTRSSDNFYTIDITTVTQGKVGLWMGNASNLGTKMSDSASGSIVFCCATPINDIPAYDGNPSTKDYLVQATAEQAKTAMEGGDGSQYMCQVPTCMFQNERLGSGAVISKEAAESKDLTLLLSFFDYLFSEEGSKLITLGLSKEQYEVTHNSLYTNYGLTEGAYTTIGEGENVKYQYVSKMEANVSGLRSAMSSPRIPGVRCLSKLQYSFHESYTESREQWIKYEATGFIGGMLGSSLTPDEIIKVGNVKSPIEQNYLHKQVYKFVTGANSLSASDWATFCSGVVSFTYKNTTVADVTKAYNDAFARLYNN